MDDIPVVPQDLARSARRVGFDMASLFRTEIIAGLIQGQSYNKETRNRRKGQMMPGGKWTHI